MLGAASVLAPGARVRHGELWMGSPAKFVRYLTEAEIHSFRTHARKYAENAYDHKQQFLPFGTQCILSYALFFFVPFFILLCGVAFCSYLKRKDIQAENEGFKVGWQGFIEIAARFDWEGKPPKTA